MYNVFVYVCDIHVYVNNTVEIKKKLFIWKQLKYDKVYGF